MVGSGLVMKFAAELKKGSESEKEAGKLPEESCMELSDDELGKAAGGTGALSAVPGVGFISGPV